MLLNGGDGRNEDQTHYHASLILINYKLNQHMYYFVKAIWFSAPICFIFRMHLLQFLLAIFWGKY